MKGIKQIQNLLNTSLAQQESYRFQVADLLATEVAKQEVWNTLLIQFGNRYLTVNKFNLNEFGTHLTDGGKYTSITQGKLYLPSMNNIIPKMGVSVEGREVYFSVYRADKSVINISGSQFLQYTTLCKVRITDILLPIKQFIQYHKWVEEHYIVSLKIKSFTEDLEAYRSIVDDLPNATIPSFVELSLDGLKALKEAYIEVNFNQSPNLKDAYNRYLRIEREKSELVHY